jgi:hypothetical protein
MIENWLDLNLFSVGLRLASSFIGDRVPQQRSSRFLKIHVMLIV